jgi:hypothetical protein
MVGLEFLVKVSSIFIYSILALILLISYYFSPAPFFLDLLPLSQKRNVANRVYQAGQNAGPGIYGHEAWEKSTGVIERSMREGLSIVDTTGLRIWGT